MLNIHSAHRCISHGGGGWAGLSAPSPHLIWFPPSTPAETENRKVSVFAHGVKQVQGQIIAWVSSFRIAQAHTGQTNAPSLFRAEHGARSCLFQRSHDEKEPPKSAHQFGRNWAILADPECAFCVFVLSRARHVFLPNLTEGSEANGASPHYHLLPPSNQPRQTNSVNPAACSSEWKSFN